jgi:phytoene dehydrogenase-like protein
MVVPAACSVAHRLTSSRPNVEVLEYVRGVILIVGSSPNELACACYLARGGQRVTVIEQWPVIDGDRGWFSPKIAKDLGVDVDGSWIEPCVVTPRLDGPGLVLWGDMARTQVEIAKHSEADARKWESFATRMARLAGFLETLYADEPPRVMSEQAGDLFSLMAVGLRLRRLGKIDMVELLRTLPMSVQDLLDDSFESELLKAAIGAGGITNILQGPRSAGTCFVMLHHLVGRPVGAFRARSRVRGLGEKLRAAAQKFGVEFVEGRATNIAVTDRRATSVQLEGGKELAATHVVSGADPRTTFLELLDPTELEPEFVRAVRSVKLRGARALMDVVLEEKPSFRGVPDEALQGLISIGPTLDYLERAYDDAKHGRISQAPFLEATLDGNVLSIAIQYVPYHLREGSWDVLAERVLATLREYAPGLRVKSHTLYTPVDLETKFGLREGHLYGGELTLDQILFMRPIPGFAQYRSPIEGLFMCGDACHPGGGLPGLAGANAARAILKDI